ncbi:histidine phosphatase family protein [Pseudomonas sp. RIT-PI-S]|uniref:histidine phosphatase family protein n=1 Tax=Pseudomonas sp. RIT-PI-S TaxID=3035295 RepID=UPI0021D82C30|nr:histidine phosphatase family protein [Pseudomonas sp. RIT-PI-S]
MALRLTLIAHGGTAAQRQARFPADEPAELDAPASAYRLGRFPRRTRFLQGPEQRVRDTAALFSSQCEVEPALRDCDFGRWAGVSIDEVAAGEPEALALWMQDWQAAPHGGESLQAVYQRTCAWLGALSGTGQVVAVTHPYVMRCALMHVLGCPPAALHVIDIEPLAAVTLSFNGRWRMRAVSLLPTAEPRPA